MIIGNGLIAKAFSEFKKDSEVLIFASGVSNSSLNSAKDFERELSLLKENISEDKLLVYFSTVSVFDKSLSSLPYILHKKKIENFVAENCKSYCIIRLPNVVGKTSNNHTLTNHIYNKISKGETVKIHKNASRYLMDIDDVSQMVSKIISANLFRNKTVNVCFSNLISMPKLMRIFSDVLKTEIKTIELERGNTYDVENGDFRAFLKNHNFTISEDYNRSLIKKYYGKHP